jgi:hypothetical protein
MTYSVRKFFIGFISFFAILLFFLIFPNNSYAAVATWTNGGGDGLWSTCANWSGGTGAGGCPGTADIATFNSTSNTPVSIDTSISVSGINMTTGYTNTITQANGTTITVGSSNFAQSTGVFTGGDATSSFDINDGSFTVSGGTHTATTGTWTVERNFTSSGGTLTMTGSTVTFDGDGFNSDDTILTCTGDLGGTVNIAKSTFTGNDFTLAGGCNIELAASITTSGSITNNGVMGATDITLKKNFTQNGIATISGILLFNGATNSGTQTLSCNETLSGNVDVDLLSFANQTFTVDTGCTATFVTDVSTWGSIVVNGEINATNITVFEDFTENGTATINGTLTFEDITSGHTSTLSCSGIFSGTVDVVFNTFVNSIFQLGDGCEATFASSINTYGSMTIDGVLNATNITITHSFTLNGSANISGTLTLDDITSGVTSVLSCTGTFPASVDTKFDTFLNGTLSIGDGCTVNLVSSDTVQGNVTVTGTLNATNPIILKGLTQNGTLNITGELTFGDTSSSQDSTLSCTAPITGNVAVLKDFISTNTLNLTSSCTVNNFTRTDGQVDNPASPYTLTVQGDFSMSTTDAFGGANLTLNMAPTTGTKTITQNAGTMSGLFNVTTSGGATVQLATDFTTGSTCNVVEGIFDINGKTFTCGSTFTVEDGGTLELFGNETLTSPTLSSGSTVKYTGNGDSLVTAYTIKDYDYHHLTIISTDATDTFATPNATEDALGNFTLSSGVFTAPSGNFTITGNFDHSGGTFTHNLGTVVLNGSGQTVSGSTTFNNFTKETSSTDTLTFTAGTTQTIGETLTISGAASNLLLLRSSSEDTQWSINPSGTRTISYLDVQDSNNTDSTVINAVGTNSVSSGGNTNWTFFAPNTPTSLGPTAYVNGSETSENQPELTFSISDDDSEDTVQYRIQIDDNSDFSSPTVDYTSALGSQGAKSFTVGQLEGSGTYTEGLEGQQLADDSYYWRIKAIDEYGTEGSYSTANSGSIAFVVSTVTPTPTPTPATSSSTSVTNTSTPPVCSNSSPTSSPQLFRIDTRATSITLFFNSVNDALSYVIAYGLTPEANNWGANYDFSAEGGVLQFTINDLSPNTTYYVRLRGGNGCATGPWSETLSAKTLSGFATLTTSEERIIDETILEEYPDADSTQREQLKQNLTEKILEEKNKELEEVETTNISFDTSFITNAINGIKAFAYNILSPIRESLENTTNTIGKNIAATIDLWFDSNPTVISNVKAEEIGEEYMVITWETNHYATSKVNYGDSYDYGKDVQTTEKTKQHSIKITNLEPNTTYYYEVMSQGNNYVFDARHEVRTRGE